MLNEMLFIIGAARSGTSWIAKWLAGHPRVISGPETWIFFSIDKIINDVSSHWILDKEKGIKICRNFLNEYYLLRKQNEQQDYLVDKTPKQFYCRHLIHQIYPKAKFLHIYRDGKYNVYSRLTWKVPWNNASPEDAIQLWMDAASVIYNPRIDMDINKTLYIKYEDLLSDMKAARKITDFMNISYRENLIPWRHPTNTTNTSFDSNRWKTLSSEILSKMKIMNDLLTKLGYDIVE